MDLSIAVAYRVNDLPYKASMCPSMLQQTGLMYDTIHRHLLQQGARHVVTNVDYSRRDAINEPDQSRSRFAIPCVMDLSKQDDVSIEGGACFSKASNMIFLN